MLRLQFYAETYANQLTNQRLCVVSHGICLRNIVKEIMDNCQVIVTSGNLELISVSKEKSHKAEKDGRKQSK